MTVDVVAFDFDGVLNEAFVFASWLEREHGVGPAERRRFFGGPFLDCQAGRADLLDTLPPFLDRWGWPGTVESFIATWIEKDDNLDLAMLALIDEVRATGRQVVVATNQERHRAAAIRKHPRLRGRVDAWLFSCDIGTRKPGRHFFERAGQAMGREGGGILLIDDDFANVRAASQSGWQADQFRDAAGCRDILRRRGVIGR